MSNALSLTGAFALGLPISVGFAAFHQLVRWRASKYTQARPDASEVDQEGLAKEREELNKAAVKRGVIFQLGSLFAWIGFFQLLGHLSSLYMVIVMGALATLLTAMTSSSFVSHVSGLANNVVARHSNQALVQKMIIESKTKWLMLPATIFSAFIVAIPFMFPENFNMAFIGYFVLAATIPFSSMGQSNNKYGNGRSASVKWRLFGMALFGFSVIAAMAVITGIIFACIYLFDGKDGSSKPSKAVSAQEKYYQRLNGEVTMFSLLPIQLAVMLGLACHVLAPLYRSDWMLTHQKPGVRLHEDKHDEVEQEIFSNTMAIETITTAEIERKDLGKVVVIPSLPQLIKRGQVGHFLARPLYTGTTVLTLQLTMLGCTRAVNEVTRRWNVDMTARESGHFNGVLGIFATLFLFPHIVFIVLGLLSAVRGEFSFVFNHAADWNARVAEEDVTESLLLGGEKEDLSIDEKC